MTDRPLHGRTVVVTRSEEQAPSLVGALRRLGADTVELPSIRIVPPADGGEALQAAARRAGAYDWVVFTSVNTVERFVACLEEPLDLAPARIAAMGPGTAAALGRAGLGVDLVPPRFVAESLLEAFPPPSGGRRVLLPQAAVARDVLPRGLSEAGWEVDVVEAYRTERGEVSAEALAAAAGADAITFTSPSTVRNYLELAGADRVPPLVACIGPVTAAAARRAGLGVDVEAEVHTVEGLARALAARVAPRSPTRP